MISNNQSKTPVRNSEGFRSSCSCNQLKLRRHDASDPWIFLLQEHQIGRQDVIVGSCVTYDTRKRRVRTSSVDTDNAF
jgi:hypothetical protein